MAGAAEAAGRFAGGLGKTLTPPKGSHDAAHLTYTAYPCSAGADGLSKLQSSPPSAFDMEVVPGVREQKCLTPGHKVMSLSGYTLS